MKNNQVTQHAGETQRRVGRGRWVFLLLLVVTGTSLLADQTAYRNYVMGLNPSGYWRFDEVSGTTAADSSSLGANGTYVSNMVLGQPGAFAAASVAARFSGGYVSVSNASPFLSTTGFSVSGWIKATNSGGQMMIVNKENSYEMGLNANVLQGSVETVGVGGWFWVGSSSISANTWYHVAFTYDSSDGIMRLFRYGVLLTNVVLGGAVEFPTPLEPLLFGIRSLGQSPFFGWMDEMAYFPRALGASDISAQYNAGILGFSVQPQNQTVAPGSNAVFSAIAQGNPFPVYQWKYNDSVIPGATNSSFSVTNASLGNVGTYSVVISNSYGSVTSSVAQLVLAGSASGYAWTNFVGFPGVAGYLNATGAVARLADPNGLAIDRSGKLYVAEYSSNIVRKVTPAGAISLIAGGAGVTGSVDGAGVAARFRRPSGMALDTATNAYVTDSGNYTLRKITPGGTVSTLAGLATNSGTADGTGSAARFSGAHGVAVDATGVVYVADTGSHTIRRVTPAGVVSTWIGSAGTAGTNDGTGASARLSSPRGLAFDRQGNLFVAESGNHTIRKITPAGVASTFAGSAGLSGSLDGLGSAARFSFPISLSFDEAGDLFVSDHASHLVRKITPAGLVSTIGGVAGQSGTNDGIGSAARFNSPHGLAVHADGTLYLADDDNHRIAKGTPLYVPVVTLMLSNRSVPYGSNVTFQAGVSSGSPATYQWYFNSTSISGETNSTLAVVAATMSNQGNYQVIVGNVYGAVTSSVATLTLLLPPSITSAPVDTNVMSGAVATFVAGASGAAPLAYQWQFNTTNLAGATNSTLTISNAAPANAGGYRAVVTNPYGSATSSVAMLTVLVPPALSSVAAVQGVGGTNLQVSGVVAPGSQSATVSVNYGLTPSLGSLQSVGAFSGTNSQPFNVSLYPSGLVLGSTYFYQVIASNALGTATSGVKSLVFAPGASDLSFGTNGVAVTPFVIGTNVVNAFSAGIVRQSNGRLVVGGHRGTNGATDVCLAGYGSDGTLDPSFGAAGLVTTSVRPTDDYGQGLVIDAEGRVIVTGTTTVTNDIIALRYLINGTPDLSYATNGAAVVSLGAGNDWGSGSVVQSDGKLVICGTSLNTISGNSDLCVIRLLTNGTLDPSFNGTGKFTVALSSNYTDEARGVAQQADGKLVLGGRKYVSPTAGNAIIVRVNTNGSLDAGFGTGGVFETDNGGDDLITAVRVLPDGRIVACGITTPTTNGTDSVVMRLTTNGLLDSSFNGTGKWQMSLSAGNDTLQGLTLHTDDRVVAVGAQFNGTNFDMAVVRLTSGGSLDTNFNGTGRVSLAPGVMNDSLSSVLIQPDGAIVASGRSETASGTSRFAVVRLLGGGLSPLLVSVNPTNITSGGADLTGSINPNGAATVGWINYGLTTNYGTVTSVVLTPNTGTNPVVFTSSLTGLSPGTSYHYRLTASNAYGVTVGPDRLFTTSSTNALLANLVPSVGTLSPAFSSITTNYTVQVTNFVSSITLTPVLLDSTAVVTVNGSVVASGSPSGAIALGYGSNVVSTVVTAQDGLGVKTYTVSVVRSFPVPGTLDLGWGSGGKVITPGGTYDESANGVAVQADGRVVAVGYHNIGANMEIVVVRYNRDGTLDTNFNGTGKVVMPIGLSHDYAQSVAVQPDGRIVVAGYSYSGTNTLNDVVVLRYLTNGALDLSFNGTGVVITDFNTNDDYGQSVALQPDGKIVVAGSAWVTGSGNEVAVARYLTNGSLDASFGVGGKVVTPIGTNSDYGYGVVVQNDGKLVVAGTYLTSLDSYSTRKALVRYNSDGTLDTSFSGTGIATNLGYGEFRGVVLQGNDRIVAVTSDWSVMRFLTNGTLDPTLGGTGQVKNAINPPAGDFGYCLALQSDEKILVGGSTYNGTNGIFALMRYNTDGGLDTTFNGTGFVTTVVGSNWCGARAMALRDDGKVFLAGYANNGVNNDIAVVGYDTVTLPLSVVTGDATNVAIHSATILGSANPQGHVMTARFEYGLTAAYGSSTNVVLSLNNGTNVQPVSVTLTGLLAGTVYHYRLTATTDEGFGSGLNRTFRTISTNANLTNLVVSVGALTPAFSVSGTNYTISVRNTTNATTLTPFAADVTSVITVNGVTVPSGTASPSLPLLQGTNVLAVAVTAQDGVTVKTYTVRVVRSVPVPGDLQFGFGVDGVVETAVSSGNDYGKAVAVQADGKVLLAGYGASGITVVRYLTNGNLDTTFNGTGKVMTNGSYCNGVAVQPDGRIVLAGGSGSDFLVLRYNSDGTPDTSFNGTGRVTNSVGIGPDEALAVVLQPDGKIVTAGYSYTNFSGGFPDIALARYTTNGTLDTSFNGTGKASAQIGTRQDYARSVALQPDGKIVVAGDYHNGTNFQGCVVRFNPDGTLDGSFGTGGKVITAVGVSITRFYGVAVQGDGRILATGHWYDPGDTGMALVRYLTNGALDAAFNGTGKIKAPGGVSGYGVSVQGDGRIVVGGSSGFASTSAFGLWRYQTNGSPDPASSFGFLRSIAIGTNNAAYGNALALSGSGIAYVGGDYFNGTNQDLALVAFKLGPFAPAIETLAATSVTNNSATLNGLFNPMGQASSGWFEYGTTTNYGSVTNIVLAPNNGTNTLGVSAVLSGLSAGTTYHYRLAGTNASGFSAGNDLVFVTASATNGGVQSLTNWFGIYGLTGGNALPGADPDGDGLNNLLEYAFGSSPAAGADRRLPTQLITNGRLGLSIPLNLQATGVTYHVQWSADLSASWTPVTNFTPSSAGVSSNVVVTSTNTVGGPYDAEFLRLDVTQP